MAGAAPVEVIADVNPDAIPADAPPPAAQYREAEVQGIACANCTKFHPTGEVVELSDGEVPVGYCDQWEARVQGDHVSDAFTDDSPAIDENGEDVWDFADNTPRVVNEIHLAGTDQREEGGFVVKEVLRTGEWPAIPTKAGLIRKPLRVVRDGVSNPDNGIIALSELVQNFQSGAIQNPQIPLSDDENDHKNLTRVNTGFIRDLWIVDEGDQSKLLAKMEFTEPEVRDKVLRGTYADVSCGIPWAVQSRGQRYGASLEHVAITNRPFIDGLGPFLAASDKAENTDVAHFSANGEVEEEQEVPEPLLSYREQIDSINLAVVQQLGLSSDYVATDIKGGDVFIANENASTTWTAPFTITGTGVGENGNLPITLAPTNEWKTVEEEGQNEPVVEEEDNSPSQPETQLSDLEQAQRMRELRLSQSKPNERGNNMPISREELERLELSDDARATIQGLLDETAELRATAREAEADRRIGELKDLGFADRPGFLKLYRDVYLSDDGGPAVILSENGQEKERLTALEILDQSVEAIKGDDDKVQFAAQHVASGNEEPPPATPEDENKSVEERLAEARESLFGKKK